MKTSVFSKNTALVTPIIVEWGRYHRDPWIRSFSRHDDGLLSSCFSRLTTSKSEIILECDDLAIEVYVLCLTCPQAAGLIDIFYAGCRSSISWHCLCCLPDPGCWTSQIIRRVPHRPPLLNAMISSPLGNLGPVIRHIRRLLY